MVSCQECVELLSTYLWLPLWSVLDLESYDESAMNIYKSLPVACGTAVWPSMVGYPSTVCDNMLDRGSLRREGRVWLTA